MSANQQVQMCWHGKLTLKSLLTKGDCLLWVTYSGVHFLALVFGLLGAGVADEAGRANVT